MHHIGSVKKWFHSFACCKTNRFFLFCLQSPNTNCWQTKDSIFHRCQIQFKSLESPIYKQIRTQRTSSLSIRIVLFKGTGSVRSVFESNFARITNECPSFVISPFAISKNIIIHRYINELTSIIQNQPNGSSENCS